MQSKGKDRWKEGSMQLHQGLLFLFVMLWLSFCCLYKNSFLCAYNNIMQTGCDHTWIPNCLSALCKNSETLALRWIKKQSNRVLITVMKPCNTCSMYRLEHVSRINLERPWSWCGPVWKSKVQRLGQGMCFQYIHQYICC